MLGPWLGGALAQGGNESWGFTAFAIAGLLGAVAVSLVPLAARLGSRSGGAPAGQVTVDQRSSGNPV